MKVIDIKNVLKELRKYGDCDEFFIYLHGKRYKVTKLGR